MNCDQCNNYIHAVMVTKHPLIEIQTSLDGMSLLNLKSKPICNISEKEEYCGQVK